MSLPDLFFGPLAYGNVADYGEHEFGFVSVRPVLRPRWAQGHLDADLLTVLPHRGKVEGRIRVDVGTVARLGVAGYARPVRGLEGFGNQRFDAQVQGLGGRVAEHLRGRRIPKDYALGFRVGHYHSVPDPLEEPAEAQILRTQPLTHHYIGPRSRKCPDETRSNYRKPDQPSVRTNPLHCWHPTLPK